MYICRHIAEVCFKPESADNIFKRNIPFGKVQALSVLFFVRGVN